MTPATLTDCILKHYEKPEQAHKAVKMLNDYEICGQKLYVGVKTIIFPLTYTPRTTVDNP